jgi:hypothetical protein
MEEVHRFNPHQVHQSNQQLSESLRNSDAEGLARILLLSEVSGIPGPIPAICQPTRGPKTRASTYKYIGRDQCQLKKHQL